MNVQTVNSALRIAGVMTVFCVGGENRRRGWWLGSTLIPRLTNVLVDARDIIKQQT